MRSRTRTVQALGVSVLVLLALLASVTSALADTRPGPWPC